jgi:hypothetical protein
MEVAMRSIKMNALILAGACVALAGGSSRAEATEILNVQVPFPFVVQQRVFPAGHYQLKRDDDRPWIVQIRGRKTGMFVLTNNAAGHDPDGDTPAVTFKKHENTYRLSKIWESANEGQAIAGKK